LSSAIIRETIQVKNTMGINRLVYMHAKFHLEICRTSWESIWRSKASLNLQNFV